MLRLSAVGIPRLQAGEDVNQAKETKMLELLEKFVSKNDPREYMRSPFNRGEWTYATNGHIAVRVPKIDGVETPPEKHAPNNLEDLFQSASGNAF